jgi:hypothetical protein
MKELILITSHTPDNVREDLLRNLVKSAKNDKYDIMVVSHTPIPNDIINNVDYFIFDKKNSLITEIKDKSTIFFSNSNFIIQTTETKKYYHGLAFIRLLKLGLTTAKNLEYEKIHFFEYDSVINSFIELQENSKLLDSVGTVCYKPLTLEWPNSPISFNVDKLSKLWFELSDDKFLDFISDKFSKISEEYQMFLIEDGGDYIMKDFSVLENKNIKVALFGDSDKFPWFVVVYDNSKNELFFFGWNQNNNDCDVKIIINNNSVIHKQITPGCWNLNEIGNFDNINNIMIIVNNEIKNNLDFNLIDKNIFKSKNYIERY